MKHYAHITFAHVTYVCVSVSVCVCACVLHTLCTFCSKYRNEVALPCLVLLPPFVVYLFRSFCAASSSFPATARGRQLPRVKPGSLCPSPPLSLSLTSPLPLCLVRKHFVFMRHLRAAAALSSASPVRPTAVATGWVTKWL